jgi:glycosyltransferase involved in cell wall biosynthesis
MLVVRGDLRSETGWSRATRALLEALGSTFGPVVGVDLHYHPRRSKSEFPYPILDDQAVLALIENAPESVVLHAALPHEVFRIPGVVNLVWWFWETDALPALSDWGEHLDSVDAILVPSPWQADWLSCFKPKPPIFVVRWPQSGEAAQAGLLRQHELKLYRTWSAEEQHRFVSIDRRRHSLLSRVTFGRRSQLQKERQFSDTVITFRDALSSYDGYFFAVQTDAPRKGLPVLVNEWCRYRARATANHALVIRFSALDVTLSPVDIVGRFMNIAFASGRGEFSALADIYLLVDEVPEAALNGLYASAVAFIAPTYGEGFGSTIVEAAFAGCPPVAPAHTACDQLLPKEYSFRYESVPYVGTLIGQLPIQPPNGAWNLPKTGAIADQLLALENSSASYRTAQAKILRDHLIELLKPSDACNAVKRAVVAARGAVSASRSIVQGRFDARN